MPNTLPVKIKISDPSQEKVRMRDFFTDYQMAVDSIGVIGEIQGLDLHFDEMRANAARIRSRATSGELG